MGVQRMTIIELLLSHECRRNMWHIKVESPRRGCCRPVGHGVPSWHPTCHQGLQVILLCEKNKVKSVLKCLSILLSRVVYVEAEERVENRHVPCCIPPFTLKKVDVDMLFRHACVRSLVESSRRTQLFKVGTVDRSMPVDV